MNNLKKFTKGSLLAILMAFVLSILAACSSDDTAKSDEQAKSEVATIAMSTLPTKTQYEINDALALAGIAVRATYTDGTSVPVTAGDGTTGYIVSGFDSKAAGSKVVTVTYQSKTATFNVTVLPVHYAVSYTVEDATTTVQVGDKALLEAPAKPDKGEPFYFVGWFIEDAGQGHMWDFAHDKVESDLVLKAKFVELSAANVIVDAYLDEAKRTAFTLKTLQELKAANIADGTTVNFTPGVYWTDDYKDSHNANTPEHPGLVGISFSQAGLIFKGLTSNADDVRIAGNRGQTMGSNGNWNVIGIGTNFSAYNLSIANYTSFDLVFPRDPSQNLPRRGDARVQAQTITGAGGSLDKMYFENVRFVSFLNLIAIGPTRAYFKNSYFQLTDDSIAGGSINVFENCTFDFYGSHPSGGGSSTIAAFLHSTFNFYNDSPVFWFSKNGGTWTVIDNVFKEPKEEIRWENTQRPDVKHYVYNNVYEDGTPVVFDLQNTQVTQPLTGDALKVFKVGEEYNVYNLLKGNDGWDPSNQQQKFDTAFKFTLGANSTNIQSDNLSNEVIITPTLVPVNFFAYDAIEFDYNQALFTELNNAGDGKLHLRANLNSTGVIINSVVKATAPNGLVAQVTLNIRPETVAAPVVVGTPSIQIGQNTAALQIVYDHPEFTDWSTITWYRGSAPGDKAVQVAVTTLNDPYMSYQLTGGDIGQYLTAVITPKYEFSPAAVTSIEVTSPRAIVAGDVANPFVIATDFANITWTGHTLNQSDLWYADAIKPSDVNQIWTPSAAAPWTYVMGDRDGALGVPGLRTATQGARLLYQPQGSFSDTSLSLDLTPEKIAGQGFGSATDQYLEVYIKWDPVTQTGYALRFQRLASDPLNGNQPIPSSGNSVRVSMIEYVNGVRTILPNCYVESSVYMPGAHLDFKLVGNVLSADVTTESEQSNTQEGYNLPSEIHFSVTLPSAASTVGGFGFQFTGTVSAGNRTELEKVEVTLTPR
ncbi:MAG TPA: bacterial Ig-like domain-containing protein [Steroidobacteraceae bacterium]